MAEIPRTQSPSHLGVMVLRALLSVTIHVPDASMSPLTD